ncbi:hypothetical protein Bbelb_242980 [Branchiostoma belcheri]|nr:hypothetical protein Bbelb_242980 [Branchiostoma belcheri]
MKLCRVLKTFRKLPFGHVLDEIKTVLKDRRYDSESVPKSTVCEQPPIPAQQPGDSAYRKDEGRSLQLYGRAVQGLKDTIEGDYNTTAEVTRKEKTSILQSIMAHMCTPRCQLPEGLWTGTCNMDISEFAQQMSLLGEIPAGALMTDPAAQLHAVTEAWRELAQPVETRTRTNIPLGEEEFPRLIEETQEECDEQWEGGCDFHGDKRCTCGVCDYTSIKCSGKPYAVRHPLTCPMHSMAYRIDCEERAAKSTDVSVLIPCVDSFLLSTYTFLTENPGPALREAKDTRWLSHDQACTALYKSLPADFLSLDHEGKGNAVASGLLKWLKSFQAMATLYLLSVNLLEIHSSVQTTVDVISGMSDWK